MKESFNRPPPLTPEVQKTKEGFAELSVLFSEAEKVFESEGRESAKPLLPKLYDTFMALNKWDKANWNSIEWNPGGELTEAEFNELNLRRKKLSNVIGIMAKAADGTVYIRHDLNKI